MEVHKEVSGGAKALAVLLCVLSVIPLVAGLLIMSLSGVFSEGNLKKMIHSSEVEEMVSSASDEFADELQYSLGIEKDDLDDINGLMEDIMVDMARFAITGQGDPIPVSQVMKQLKKQVKKLEKSSDIEIDEDQLEKIEDYLKDANKEFKKYVDDEVENEPGIEMVRSLVSGKMGMIIYVVAAVLLGIVFLLMINRKDKALKYIGVTGIVSSVFGFIIGALIMLAKSQAGKGEETVALIVGMMGSNALIYACIYFVVGVALIIVGKSILKNHMGDAVNA